MDENLTTASEPQVIESTVDATQTPQIPETDIETGSTVVEQATPMDNNVTYDNVPKNEITIDPNKDFTQNVVENTINIERNNNIVNNSGTYFSNFLDHEYDYDREEAGSYWVAGAINDNETQMSFLNSLINEEMYDTMDLQKYYYDTTMATARAYAAQKERETAYGFYRAAQEKAIAEAQLTGWYMPAEGQYMLMEYEVAQQKLKDNEATPEDIAKANRVIGVTEKWFNANQIGTRGIKCLSMMNYEENVRHNTIMGELQKQANAIQASGAAASAASAALQLRELKFQLEEYELQSGHDITKQIGLDDKDFIGHDTLNDPDYAGKYTALEGYGTKEVTKKELFGRAQPGDKSYTLQTKDVSDRISKQYGVTDPEDIDFYYWKEELQKQGKDLIKETDSKGVEHWYQTEQQTESALANTLATSNSSYTAILNATSREYVDDVLRKNGIDPDKMYQKYLSNYGDVGLKKSVEDNGYMLDESYLNKEVYKVRSDGKYSDFKDKNVYTFHCTEKGQAVTKAYLKDNDGNFVQLKSGDVKLVNGTLSDKIDNLSTSVVKYDGHEIQVGQTHTSSQFDTHKVHDTNTGEDIKVMNELPKGAEKIDDGQEYSDHAKYKDKNGVTHYFEYRNYSYKLNAGERAQNFVQGLFSLDGDLMGADEATSYGWVEVPPSEFPDEYKSTADSPVKGLNQESMAAEEIKKAKENPKQNNVKTSGGGSGGASAPSKVSNETQNTVSDAKAEYKEYVSRMEKEHPGEPILSFVEWDKDRPTINQVRT